MAGQSLIFTSIKKALKHNQVNFVTLENGGYYFFCVDVFHKYLYEFKTKQNHS